MASEEKSTSPGFLEDFDWKQLKGMGGREGELSPQPSTIPLAELEGIDATARPDLAQQVLPRTHSPEDVIDKVLQEQQIARVKGYISHLRPEERETIIARYGLDGSGEKTIAETAEHLDSVGISGTRQRLARAERHVRQQANVYDQRDTAKYSK